MRSDLSAPTAGSPPMVWLVIATRPFTPPRPTRSLRISVTSVRRFLKPYSARTICQPSSCATTPAPKMPAPIAKITTAMTNNTYRFASFIQDSFRAKALRTLFLTLTLIPAPRNPNATAVVLNVYSARGELIDCWSPFRFQQWSDYRQSTLRVARRDERQVNFGSYETQILRRSRDHPFWSSAPRRTTQSPFLPDA